MPQRRLTMALSAVARGEGVLVAAFTGHHGWFWHNCDTQE